MRFGSFKKELEIEGKIFFKVKVIPNAQKTEVKEIMADETIKIAVVATPEKGRANYALIKFLAKEFGVDKTEIKIVSGKGSRLKLVKVEISRFTLLT